MLSASRLKVLDVVNDLPKVANFMADYKW